MYIAQSKEDGSFDIFLPREEMAINGNSATILGMPVRTISQADMDDWQSMLDAIASCQGGADVKTQYTTAMNKAAQPLERI